MRKLVIPLAVFLLSAIFYFNKSPNNYDAANNFEELCNSSSRVIVIDLEKWKEYSALSKKNSNRIDGKPSLIEGNGFTFSFGEKESWASETFPIGLHEAKINIYYNKSKIAVLLDHVLMMQGANSFKYRSCMDGGLERYVKNGDF